MMPLIAPPRFLIDEIVLVDVLAFFLSIATVSILWYVVKKIFPDEVRDLRFFSTFILVVVPFIIIVYFGAAVINYNAIATQFDWPEVLPLNGLLPPAIVVAAAFYIGQTAWLWWSWRKSSFKPRRAPQAIALGLCFGLVANQNSRLSYTRKLLSTLPNTSWLRCWGTFAI